MDYSRIFTCLALLAIITFSIPVQAIVNIEDEHVKESEQGFSGKLSLAAHGQSGNTEKKRVGLGTRLQWTKDRHTSFVVLNHSYGKTNDTRDTNKTFLHGRYIHNTSPRKAWEIFIQAEQNEFTRLEYRGLFGAGGRFTFGRPEGRKKLILGAGVFRSREELDDRAGTTDAGIERLWRANFYLSAKYRTAEKINLVSTTYYQPSFRDSDDYRFFQQLGLHVKLNNKLNLKLTIEVSYDNHPPQTIKKTDSVYSTGIEYRF